MSGTSVQRCEQAGEKSAPKYGAKARRVVTFLSATELKYSNPGSTIGGQLDVCGSATSNAMLELVRAMRNLTTRESAVLQVRGRGDRPRALRRRRLQVSWSLARPPSAALPHRSKMGVA
jgi:hypothetical protein